MAPPPQENKLSGVSEDSNTRSASQSGPSTKDVPGVTINYSGLEGEGKWRLEQVFRFWCEWYEGAFPRLKKANGKGPSGGFSKGKMGYSFPGGMFVSEEQLPGPNESFSAGESISFNLEYEQRFQKVPLYDRGCGIIPLSSTPSDAPPSHHVSPRCFNCGSYNHGVRDCSREYSLSDINKNKATYAGPIGSARGGRSHRGRQYTSGRRDPKDSSGMKRFLQKDDVEDPRDRPESERESGKRRRDWFSEDSRHHRQQEKHPSAQKSESRVLDAPATGTSPRSGRGQKKAKITETPKQPQPEINSLIASEIIELSSEGTMEEGEASDDDGDESDSADEVILITRGNPSDAGAPVEDNPEAMIPPPAPPLPPPVRGCSADRSTRERLDKPPIISHPQVSSKKDTVPRNDASKSDGMDPPISCLPPRKEPKVFDTVAAIVSRPQRSTTLKPRTEASTCMPAKPTVSDLHGIANDDKEEGELDVEEGEIVETPQGPKSVSEPGLFFPVATNAGPEPPTDRNIPASAKSRRPSGYNGQTSHGSRGRMGPPGRHPRPSPRRMVQGAMKSKSPAPAVAATAAAAQNHMQAPFLHRHSQTIASHQQQVSQPMQKHHPMVGGGLTQQIMGGSQLVHTQQLVPRKYESIGVNNQNTSSAVHSMIRDKGHSTYLFGQNPQVHLPVTSNCHNIEPQAVAHIRQYTREAQLAAQTAVLQQGVVGQQQQQQPLLSRNPQIVASTSTMQHQVVQQPFVHISGPTPQPGAIGLQQEHHGQMVRSVPGQVSNGQFHFAQQQQQQQQQPQHFVAPQPAMPQQLVQVGNSMVVINGSGQQVVVKPAGR